MAWRARTSDIKHGVPTAARQGVGQLALAVGVFCGFIIISAGVVGLLTADWVAVRWATVAMIVLAPVGYWYHRDAGAQTPEKRRPGSWY